MYRLYGKLIRGGYITYSDIQGGMGMCGELQALSVLSAWKETPYPVNSELCVPQHSVR